MNVSPPASAKVCSTEDPSLQDRYLWSAPFTGSIADPPGGTNPNPKHFPRGALTALGAESSPRARGKAGAVPGSRRRPPALRRGCQPGSISPGAGDRGEAGDEETARLPLGTARRDHDSGATGQQGLPTSHSVLGSRREARATQRGRKEAGGDGESAAPRHRGRLREGLGQGSTGVEKLPQPPPVPLSAVARPWAPPGGVVRPAWQRWPRGDGRGTGEDGGDALPAPRRGPGLAAEARRGIRSKAGGCPKRLSRLCRDTDGLALSPRTAKPLPAAPASPPASRREKTAR